MANGVWPSQLRRSAKGQGGEIKVDFLPELRSDRSEMRRLSAVPLRFVHASQLSLEQWRTLHLGLNCHFDPPPDRHCAHAKPCVHRGPGQCDHPSRPSVRSWAGKREDFGLSRDTGFAVTDVVSAICGASIRPLPRDQVVARVEHFASGRRGQKLRSTEFAQLCAHLDALEPMPTELPKGSSAGLGGRVGAVIGAGSRLRYSLAATSRGAHTAGMLAAFYSASRTPNPHVGDGGMGPFAWKTSLLWGEVGKHAERGVLLWEPSACVNQVAVSQGQVDAAVYAESVLAAMEECDALWVHASSDYCISLYTVLELATWHRWRTIHPSNTVLLNAMEVASVSGRTTRLPLLDVDRDHSAWLQGQLRKHGSPGREYCAAFLTHAGVDVREPQVVRGAFAALEAIAASAVAQAADGSQQAHETYYAPHYGLPQDWDLGWATRPPTRGAPPAGLDRPPLSKWHPGPHAPVWLCPGLASDRRSPGAKLGRSEAATSYLRQ